MSSKHRAVVTTIMCTNTDHYKYLKTCLVISNAETEMYIVKIN